MGTIQPGIRIFLVCRRDRDMVIPLSSDVVLSFIDDHSRLIVYARFYLSENLAAFMDAFEKALLKRGLPRKLYVDKGRVSKGVRSVSQKMQQLNRNIRLFLDYLCMTKNSQASATLR